jgi:hypothetical protein
MNNKQKQYTGFTVKDHSSIAEIIRDADGKITDLCWEVAKKYGKTSAQFKKARNTLAKVRDLKNSLDFEYFLLNRNEYTDELYYGTTRPTKLPAVQSEPSDTQSSAIER